MQYMRAYQFITDSKNYFMNVLMGVVCSLIPFIGGIVYDGYLFEVIDSLHEDPDHRDYPDFDFNRFTTYLMRGLWPFLANLILSLLVAVPIVLATYALIIVGVLVFHGGVMTYVCIAAAIVLGLVGSVVLALIELPMIIHAGLARELRFKEMLAFARDFVPRMWKEELLVVLFLMVTAPILSMIGVCAFFVGVYFAAVVIDMATHHFYFQLYELYLKRGGSPIRRAGESTVSEVEAV